MTKTVSFTARDELAEWLESRAEAEMKSISAVCQDIVAQEYRRAEGQTASDWAEGMGFQGDSPLEEPPFTKHPEAWYEPTTEDADHLVGVRIPEAADLAEDRRYYKTYDGAAKAIRRWYE